MSRKDRCEVRLLLVEDDRRLANTLARGLDEEGFGVDITADGDEAVAAANQTAFDVILLDVMLPGQRDGFQVCALMRAAGLRTPILMLTARDAIDDRVKGLDAGADDYLVKPFAFRELLARVRALTRRVSEQKAAALRAGELVLDTAAHELTVNGTSVDVTAKELAILEYFMHHPRRVLTRQQIEEHVWNYEFDSTSNLVDVYVARLRRRLIAAGAGDPITTVRGVGYRFDKT